MVAPDRLATSASGDEGSRSEGAGATPNGLRHAFGIVAIAATVPLTIIPKWIGHSDLATIAIYLDVSGPEERLIAIRMWHGELWRIA